MQYYVRRDIGFSAREKRFDSRAERDVYERERFRLSVRVLHAHTFKRF